MNIFLNKTGLVCLLPTVVFLFSSCVDNNSPTSLEIEKENVKTASSTGIHTYVLPSNKRNLTYRVVFTGAMPDGINGPMTQAEIRDAIRYGLSIWSTTCRISFKETTSSTADITYNVYKGTGNSNSSLGVPATVNFICNAAWYNSVMCGEDFVGVTLHETGHVLGFLDMQWEVWPTCSMAGDETGSAPCPTPRGGMHDVDYWNWRMRYIPPLDECTPPMNYRVQFDTRVSIMDYDCLGKPMWRLSHIGFWGRGLFVEGVSEQNIQHAYPCGYDINILETKYGSPTNTLPILTMRLTTDWYGNDYTGDSYMTTSWDDANSKCLEFSGPVDVREIAGLSLKTSGSGRVQIYRYFNSSNNDYCVSSQTSLPGWTREASLGYWRTSQGNVTATIGTLSKSRPTIPIYQYYKPSIDRHIVGPVNMQDGWDGWQKTTVGYIIAYSALCNP
jgi:hypothetical protein